MAVKKTKTFGVTGTFENVQITVDVKADDLVGALEAAKKLKFSDFITPKGDVFDFEGPEITSVWKS